MVLCGENGGLGSRVNTDDEGLHRQIGGESMDLMRETVEKDREEKKQ